MAVYDQGVDISFIAAVDLSAKQYRFVSAGSVEGEVTFSIASASTLGILQNDPVAGEEATVRVLGTSKVYADANGSALTYGGLVKSGSGGEAEGYVVGAASVFGAGVSLEALASGTGYVEVMLLPYFRI